MCIRQPAHRRCKSELFELYATFHRAALRDAARADVVLFKVPGQVRCASMRRRARAFRCTALRPSGRSNQCAQGWANRLRTFGSAYLVSSFAVRL